MTFKDNFSGFFNMWKYSEGNEGVIRRDYKLLDEIHPRRIKSAEQWFWREEEKAMRKGKAGLWERVQDMRPVLKIGEDRRKGRL